MFALKRFIGQTVLVNFYVAEREGHSDGSYYSELGILVQFEGHIRVRSETNGAIRLSRKIKHDDTVMIQQTNLNGRRVFVQRWPE